MITFEVCLQSPEDAMVAQAGGAQRVELCAALIEGGITPSYGTILACRDAVDIDIMVMIRPRGGDFLYSEVELASMARDIEFCKSVGVHGVVFGLLLPDGQIDLDNTRRLCELAHPLSITFHRAFDVCRDPFIALEQLIELGVHRVLT
ncbi:MAG: copper homeostasis protein CutC, partial [Bacteroidota bacterium]